MSVARTVDQNVTPELQRAVLRCIDKALALPPEIARDPVRSVHRVRRALKRVRAILRLVRPPHPKWIEDARHQTAALAQQLSHIRNSDVVSAAVEDLRRRRREHWSLVLPPRPPPPNTRAKGIDRELLNRLRKLRVSLHEHVWPARSSGQLRDALRRSYRSARRRRKDAMLDPTPDHLHEWRKAVVRLRFQLVAAEPWISSGARKLERRLTTLAAAVGECGDLTLVARAVNDAQSARRHPARHRALLRWLERRRMKLARRSLRAGAVYFARRSRDFPAWCTPSIRQRPG